MKRGLTSTQKERYEYIKNYIFKNGYAPTLKEMAEEFHNTPVANYYVITGLVKKGWINRGKYSERDITINE